MNCPSCKQPLTRTPWLYDNALIDCPHCKARVRVKRKEHEMYYSPQKAGPPSPVSWVGCLFLAVIVLFFLYQWFLYQRQGALGYYLRGVFG